MYKKALKDINYLLGVLNNGTVEQLSYLPGIGKKRIEDLLKIRSERHKQGETLALHDVVSVKGVSGGILGKMAGNNHVIKLVQYCQYFNTMFGDSEIPSSVVSMDLGCSNIAIAHLSSDMRLTEWERVQLHPPKPYSPKGCYKEICKLFDHLPVGGAYLIETQSHRTFGSRGFMDIGLRLRLLEAMMYSILRERGLKTLSISPKKVSGYFELNVGGKYYYKKQAASVLTCHLVGAGDFDTVITPLGNTVTVSKHLVEYYWKQKKIDDLSDCLLQAVAFLEWAELSRLW